MSLGSLIVHVCIEENELPLDGVLYHLCLGILGPRIVLRFLSPLGLFLPYGLLYFLFGLSSFPGVGELAFHLLNNSWSCVSRRKPYKSKVLLSLDKFNNYPGIENIRKRRRWWPWLRMCASEKSERDLQRLVFRSENSRPCQSESFLVTSYPFYNNGLMFMIHYIIWRFYYEGI